MKRNLRALSKFKFKPPKYLLKVLLVFAFAFQITASGKSQEQSVMAAAGGVDATRSISLEWTMGETIIETITHGKQIYTQGFHQPIIIKRVPVKSPELNILSDYLFSVAPNPVVSDLMVTIDPKLKGKVQILLGDINGRNLKTIPLSDSRTFKISLNGYPGGTYYLSIRNEKAELLKTFLIIK